MELLVTTMIELDGVYEGMPEKEYIDILEQYVRWLEDALSPMPGIMKVILPLGVEMEEDVEEVH